MATQLQFRRGNTAQTSTFTGVVAELTVDTSKNTIVVHDGSTPGGHPLATEVFTQEAFNKANAAFIAANTDYDALANSLSSNVQFIAAINATQNTEIQAKVSKAGDTMTGTLNLVDAFATGNISITGNLSASQATFTNNVQANNVIVNTTLYAGISPSLATPLPNLIAQFTGNTDSYVQINAENINPNGSSDFVATTDVGDDTTFYIDLGIQNSTRTDGALKPLDGYLYVQGNTGQVGGNLVIATASPSQKVRVLAGGLEDANTVVTFTDDLQSEFTGNVVPSTNNTQYLGSSSNRWHTLFVGPGSVDIDGVVLSKVSGKLQVSGATDIVLQGSAVPPSSQVSDKTNSAFTQANSSFDAANSASAYANSAFAQANAAFASANNVAPQVAPAFNTANAAFAHANAAYNQANTATTNAATADDKAVTAGNYANSAYNQANTATNNAAGASSYANGAFIQANAAFLQANTPSHVANSASVYANGAFIQANAAYDSQNTTGSYANSAYIQANTAYTAAVNATNFVTSVNLYAIAAFTHANAGFAAANSAGNYANAAFTAANTSSPVANSASLYANGAFVQANAAYNQANTATTNAATADSKAVTAGQYANSAYSQANTATTNAATADSKAVTAGQYANSAYNQANTATTNAATADSKAVTAGSYANSAYNQANTATNNAAGASLYANGAFAQANAAFNKANTSVQTSGINSITSGSLSITNTGGIGLTVTGNAIFNNDITVAGNVFIGGNATSFGANNITIEDSLIFLANNNNQDLVDIGFVAHFNPGAGQQHTGFARDATDDTWKLFSNVFPNPTTTIDFTNAIYDPIRVGALTASSATINGTNLLPYTQSAFGHANAAYASQNTTGTYANSAYTQANTATTNAATADSKAVTAGSYANSAFNQANTATTNAATADSKAVTAGSYANSAFNQANTATTNAATADSKAVTAGSYANSAFGVANSASLYANGAFIQANAAFTKANSALPNTTTTLNGSLSVTGTFSSLQSIGDEGGQIDLAKAATNTTINTGVSIDVFQNRVRIFESGGTNRGVFIDLANNAATSVGTNLLNPSSVTVNTDGNLTTSTFTTTASVAQVTVDSFATSTYRSAKYFAQMTAGSNYHVIELNVVHNGTTVWLAQYGEIFTNASLGTFDASIATGTLNLQFTPASATVTTIKVFRTAIAV